MRLHPMQRMSEAVISLVTERWPHPSRQRPGGWISGFSPFIASDQKTAEAVGAIVG